MSGLLEIETKWAQKQTASIQTSSSARYQSTRCFADTLKRLSSVCRVGCRYSKCCNHLCKKKEVQRDFSFLVFVEFWVFESTVHWTVLYGTVAQCHFHFEHVTTKISHLQKLLLPVLWKQIFPWGSICDLRIVLKNWIIFDPLKFRESICGIIDDEKYVKNNHDKTIVKWTIQIFKSWLFCSLVPVPFDQSKRFLIYLTIYIWENKLESEI